MVDVVDGMDEDEDEDEEEDEEEEEDETDADEANDKSWLRSCEAEPYVDTLESRLEDEDEDDEEDEDEEKNEEEVDARSRGRMLTDKEDEDEDEEEENEDEDEDDEEEDEGISCVGAVCSCDKGCVLPCVLASLFSSSLVAMRARLNRFRPDDEADGEPRGEPS